jgi:hypothetical protein
LEHQVLWEHQVLLEHQVPQHQLIKVQVPHTHKTIKAWMLTMKLLERLWLAIPHHNKLLKPWQHMV